MRFIFFKKLTLYCLFAFFAIIIFNNTLAQLVPLPDEQKFKQVEIKVAPEPKPVIEDKIKDAFVSLPFQNQILQGYIGKRFTQNLEERLLKVDENGIMSGYLH